MRAVNRTSIIRIIQQEYPYLRDQFGVDQIGLFGSFARGDAREDSDVDLLVSLSKPLGLSFFRLANYLEEKIGRKVDLITSSTIDVGLSDPHRAHIAKEIQDTVIYV